ncbi:MAG: hypothetical protein KGI72_05280 [Patescibacteria group bacterium]|nr:hypothetical protein [Patescibacteria group bacterium]
MKVKIDDEEIIVSWSTPSNINCVSCGQKLAEITRTGAISEKICANKRCQLGVDVGRVEGWRRIK